MRFQFVIAFGSCPPPSLLPCRSSSTAPQTAIRAQQASQRSCTPLRARGLQRHSACWCPTRKARQSQFTMSGQRLPPRAGAGAAWRSCGQQTTGIAPALTVSRLLLFLLYLRCLLAAACVSRRAAAPRAPSAAAARLRHRQLRAASEGAPAPPSPHARCRFTRAQTESSCSATAPTWPSALIWS